MCLESQPVFDENNQRIYIDFESGKWLEEKQKEIRLKLQTLAVVLGLIFYSDGAEAQGKESWSTGTEVWLAQLQLLFCVSSKKGAPEFAFIRWLTAAAKPARAANLKLKPYKWEVTRIPGIRSNVPKTDIVRIESIIGPCFIQPDPLDPNLFWYNHWVGNVMNDNY
ncbi:TPA: hypothetical protein ACH3X1_014648 [Trebouxia sp. C0004]